MSESSAGKTLLVISQTFVPDPASVGQHMTDVAVEMARRGYSVRVLTSARGYEDASRRYPLRETLQGVEIRRLQFGSFGKKSMLHRVLGTAAFQLHCLFAALMEPRVDAVFFSTSPPLVGVIASIIRLVRRVPIAYWAMDLNPDQLIALGKIKPRSLPARVLEAFNRLILRQSALVIALDRFMADRLKPRTNPSEKLVVIPPWPHDVGEDPKGQGVPNPFRIAHGLVDQFVVMYSGNHSPANPLSTLIQAAIRLKNDKAITFAFVGGGSGKREVEAAIREHNLTNVRSLPYQPLAELKYSLAAADVQVVTMGNDMVGIIHPCKIYGAMQAGKPLLYFGPRPSHIADLIEGANVGLIVSHGDVEAAVEAVLRLRDAGAHERNRLGAIARQKILNHFKQSQLCGVFCDRLELALFKAKL